MSVAEPARRPTTTTTAAGRSSSTGGGRSPVFARRMTLALKLGLLTLGVLYALFPVVWVLSAALSPTNTLINQSIIPQGATFENFAALVGTGQSPWALWLWNSVKISVVTSVITVFLSVLAAYAFSRFRFRGRRSGLLGILIVQLFPSILAIVALYLLLSQVGQISPWIGLNSHGGLILIYSGGALGVNTWLMKGYLDAIPSTLEEAAMVDGATRWQAFYQIVLPLIRPILAVVGILTFIFAYGDFLLPRVLLTETDQFTLALGMFQFISGQYTEEWGVFSAAALVGALPVVIVFFALQRQLISGLTQGGVKG